LILSFHIFCFSVSNAQHYVGISGGYSFGTFTNFVKEEHYNAKYHFKSGVAFSFFYEAKLDTICNLIIETQYKWQNADMKIDYNIWHASFHRDMKYSFHLLNFNLIYSFRLVEKKAFKLYFLLGPTFTYNVNTSAKGNGWDFVSQTSIDSIGNPIQILTTRHWVKNENNSKDLSKFNVGVDLGLNFIIPISNKADLFIQNRYNIFLTNFSKQNNLRYTSLFSGYVNVGFRYKFCK